ncbi:unnamed protein product [Cyclocybe aegerita]|uniref:Uncharacterized protein n=1 Tax=Cyclocybe aegerita TaxID=1973307 RepID=A0A8S0XP77_CYCAE|nr:unnamed protein product [Cyclocybe aegerita]
MKADERTLRDSGELYYCWTDKTHMKELVRQLEVVTIRDPSLAVHVNILNVTVVDHEFKSIMEKLARCIALLPNLHTVQLRTMPAWSYLECFMSNVFKQYTYPQIRTVAVCSRASPIMESCPGMVRLYAYNGLQYGCLDHFVEKSYSQVEVLGTPVDKYSLTKHSVESKYHSFVKGETLVQSLPNLRDITLDRLILGRAFDWIKPIMQLRNLQTIRLRMDSDTPALPHDRHRACAEWIKWSQHILSQNQNPDIVNKQVILTDPDGKVTVYVVAGLAKYVGL